MGESTGISWTDHTANFWMGCEKISPGCKHCYAEKLVTGRLGLPVWGPAKTTERKRSKGAWVDVPRWNRAAARDGARRRLFVSSLADVFEDHAMVAPWRAEALELLASCTSLDVQLLTKRPEHIRAMVPPAWLTSWPEHVWIGCTVEDQKRAVERIPHMLAVPAAVRFLSMEPLLEAVDLTRLSYGGATLNALTGHIAGPDDMIPERVSWVIVGGESGHKARSFDLAWARSIVGQCVAAHVPVFVKQMGDNPLNGGQHPRYLAHHGADPGEWPRSLQRQEFPR